MKLLLRVRYNGAAYCGFQYQKNAVSVQGELTEAAQRVFGEPCRITGCSRTDAGVHALNFCCTAEADGECRIPTGKIHKAFEAVLPQDISVAAAAEVPSDFHARYDCRGKKYVYRICDAPFSDPFEVGRSERCLRPISDETVDKMSAAAQCFAGTHDFASFMAAGSKITDTVRTVFKANVKREAENIVTFTVSADGFLYNMVRIMAGTLLDMAAERIPFSDMSDIIAARDRSRAGRTASACGLYLSEVFYDIPIDWRCE